MLRSAAGRVMVAGASLLLAALTGAIPAAPGHADDESGASVTLTKRLAPGQSDTVTAGGNVVYVLDLQCSSNTVSDCGPLTLTDVLAPGLSYVAATGPGGMVTSTTTSAGIDTVSMLWNSFPTGQAVSVTLTLQVKPGTPAGVIPNVATATSPVIDPVTSPPVDITVQAGPPPTPQWVIEKADFSPSGAVPGDHVVYRVALSGAGVPVVGGSVIDQFPCGAVVVDADGGAVHQSAGDIAADHCTIEWTLSDAIAPTYYAWVRNPVLRFDSPPFAVGSVVTNKVTAPMTYADGSAETLSAADDVDLVDPYTEANPIKSGAATAVPGQSYTWDVWADTTRSTTSATGLVLTDYPLPPQLDGYTLRYYLERSQFATPDVRYEYTEDGASWLPLLCDNPLVLCQNPVIGGGIGFVAVPGTATGVRMVALGPTPPGSSAWTHFGFQLTGRVRPDLVAGESFQNCAQAAGDPGVVVAASSCPSATIVSDVAMLSASKRNLAPAGVPITAGSTFQMGIGAGNVSDSELPLSDVAMSDLLPAGLDYVSTDCVAVIFLGAGWDAFWNVAQDFQRDGACRLDPPTYGTVPWLPTPTVTPNWNGTGRTLLTWYLPLNPEPVEYMGGLGIFFTVRVADGTPIGTVTNTAQVLAGDRPTLCPGPSGWDDNRFPLGTVTASDIYDANHDGAVNEIACESSADIPIAGQASVLAEKWDAGTPGLLPVHGSTGQIGDPSCPAWDQANTPAGVTIESAYTRFPCVSQTLPNSTYTYLWRLKNTGTVPLRDYVIYDILPFPGDRGVTEQLANDPRLTDWRPTLAGPVEVVGALPPGADPTQGQGPIIEYSYSSNPCRPELAAGDVDAVWQQTTGPDACDDIWYLNTEVTDWTKVRSMRARLFTTPGAYWMPGEQIIAKVTMRAPDAPLSDLTPGSVSLAASWNLIAYRAFEFTGSLPCVDSSTVTCPVSRMLATQPPKVGVIMPARGTTIPKIDLEKFTGSWDGWLTPIDVSSVVWPSGDYDDPAHPQPFLDGQTRTISMRITNTGDDDLKDLLVSDALLDINGDGTAEGPAMQDLTCDFSDAAPGAPTSGTSWQGPFPIGASFICTGTLTLRTGDVHADRARVTALAVTPLPESSPAVHLPVDDYDDYHAYAPEPAPVSLFVQKLALNTHGEWGGMAGSAWALRGDLDGAPDAPATAATWAPTPTLVGGQLCADCVWRVADLMPGTYWLVETTAPPGFSLLAKPVRFSVDADGSVTLLSDGGPAGSAIVTVAPGTGDRSGFWVLSVRDVPAMKLPAAGGSGMGPVWRLGGVASAMTLVVWVAWLRRRRRDKRETLL